MKTTLELPEPIFRKAKATAAERGQSLKDFVTEALRDKLALDTKGQGGKRARSGCRVLEAQATPQGNDPRAIHN